MSKTAIRYASRKLVLIFFLVCCCAVGLCLYLFLNVQSYTGSVADIRQLPLANGKLSDFPSTGKVEYALRDYFGGKSVLFSGHASSKEVDRFCEKQRWYVMPGEDRFEFWVEKQQEYKVEPNLFPVVLQEDVLMIEKPVKENGRIMIYYMPSSSTFTGEIILFR